MDDDDKLDGSMKKINNKDIREYRKATTNTSYNSHNENKKKALSSVNFIVSEYELNF